MYLNEGQGRFAPPAKLTDSGRNTQSLGVGDLDGDSDLDLVLGNSLQPSQVYLNNGQGRFAPPVELADSGRGTRSVAAGDLDGDGDLDLVLGNSSQPSQVYLNQGRGGFAPPVELAESGRYTSSVSVADLDGDGRLDLVLGNGRSASQVYLNQGRGRFALPVDLADSDGISDTAVGDLDNDGDLDLVLVRGIGASRVYLNQRQNGFAPPVELEGSGPATVSVVVGDLDGDGDLDIVLGNYSEPSQVYRNGGQGQFTPLVALAGSGRDTSGLAVGDLNGDGTLDLVLGNVFKPSQVYLTHEGFARQPVGTPPSARVGQPGTTKAAPFYASAEVLSGRYIRIPFTLTDADGDPVRAVRGEYSLDGGGVWRPALPRVLSDTLNLATSPQGTKHTFVWDTFPTGDGTSAVFGSSDNVVFRIIALPSLAPRPNSIAGSYPYGASRATSQFFRLRGTIARVVDTTGQPIEGALVYRLPSGERRGAKPLTHRLTSEPISSNAQGYVNSRDPLLPSEQLVAVQPVVTTARLTYAYTSAAPNVAGLSGFSVGASGGAQTITVRPTNPLLLLNLSVGIEWDASVDAAFINSLRSRLQRSSEILYDWTNGQIALGNITIYHNKQHWEHILDNQGAVITRGVDLRIYAANNIRPSATQGGIVDRPTIVDFGAPPSKWATTTPAVSGPWKLYLPALSQATIGPTANYEPGYIRIGATWNAEGNPGIDVSEDWTRALAHEISHYALFLDETYLGKQGNLLVPTNDCPSPMSDPYTDSASEFRPPTDWPAACAATLQNVSTGLSEWATIKRFYDRSVAIDGFSFVLNAPKSRADNPGPAVLPIEVTTVIELPSGSNPTAASRIFGVLPPDSGRYTPNAGARSILFPSGERAPVDLGRPEAGQIIARGYEKGDRLCVFDPAQELVGCDLSASGLRLAKKQGWKPDLQITPITYLGASGSPTMTLQIAVPAESVGDTAWPAALKIRLFPREGADAAVTVTLPLVGSTYKGSLVLPRIIEEGLVQVWVDEPEPRREAVADYAIGGNPAPRRRPSRRSRRRAPAVSPDGQATLFSENSTFNPGQFFALQRTVSLPALPSWATPVGAGYRLLASEPRLLDQRNNPLALSLSYAQSDVPLGTEDDVRVLFFNGSGWVELPTRVDIDSNEAAVQVQPQPGLYVLISSLQINLPRIGWNFIYSYPGASQELPQALQSAQSQGAYDMVYGYEPVDPTDPWKLFSPLAPAWVSDLKRVEEGSSYWLHVTKPATIALPIPGLAAQDILPPPPSTIYGVLDANWGFPPRVGLTVQAVIGNTVCGETTTRSVDSQVVFVLDVLARDGEQPECGDQGMAMTLVVLNGGDVLREVSLTWDNQKLRKVSSNGVIASVSATLGLPLFPG